MKSEHLTDFIRVMDAFLQEEDPNIEDDRCKEYEETIGRLSRMFSNLKINRIDRDFLVCIILDSPVEKEKEEELVNWFYSNQLLLCRWFLSESMRKETVWKEALEHERKMRDLLQNQMFRARF